MPDSKLDRYRAKRDPSRTPEPVPGPGDHGASGSAPPGNRPGGSSKRTPKKSPAGLRFVIQEHHARALHWDFRLERAGVLVSWALPKGLPADPGQNHLAVPTEDHPLEYADFAGEIPAGQYGGGTVSIWDHGTYDCEKWSEREIIVVLHGTRAEGRYALFATTRGAGSGARPQWMIHRMDPAPADWQALPQLVRPMLCQIGTCRPTTPAGPTSSSGTVSGRWPMSTGAGSGWGRATTGTSPSRTPSCGAWARPWVPGRPSSTVSWWPWTSRAGPASGSSRRGCTCPTLPGPAGWWTPCPSTIWCSTSCTSTATPRSTSPTTSGAGSSSPSASTAPHWATPPTFVDTPGSAVLDAARDQGLEGVVAKRRDSLYQPGRRSAQWIKIKVFAAQEVVIGGTSPGRGRRSGAIGALLVGLPGPDGLRYVGKVGTGFTDAALADLARRLDPLRSATCPFAGRLPAAQVAGASWVRPELVGEVSFGEWTRDGRLRHPVWRGLRPDKAPSDVVAET